MQNKVSQARDAPQTLRAIQIGNDRPHALATPIRALPGVMHQSENTIMAKQAG